MLIRFPALLIAVLLCLPLLWLPGSRATAHPHAYIDVKVTVEMNADGAITGLRQQWLFDPAYTAFAMYDLITGDPEAQQRKLNEILDQNLTGLAPYQYFTAIKQGTTKIETDRATTTGIHLDNGQISMVFTLPLTEPVPTGNGAIEYRIFDPSYYIQMRHSLDADAIAISPDNGTCRHQLVEPDPTTEQILMAAALAPDATAPEGLGLLFSEAVTITCSN